MSKHIKEIEFRKKKVTYALEVDTEDPENLVIESVTIIDGGFPETDTDPEIFMENLDIDDWQVIKQKLEDA